MVADQLWCSKSEKKVLEVFHSQHCQAISATQITRDANGVRGATADVAIARCLRGNRIRCRSEKGEQGEVCEGHIRSSFGTEVTGRGALEQATNSPRRCNLRRTIVWRIGGWSRHIQSLPEPAVDSSYCSCFYPDHPLPSCLRELSKHAAHPCLRHQAILPVPRRGCCSEVEIDCARPPNHTSAHIECAVTGPTTIAILQTAPRSRHRCTWLNRIAAAEDEGYN